MIDVVEDRVLHNYVKEITGNSIVHIKMQSSIKS